MGGGGGSGVRNHSGTDLQHLGHRDSDATELAHLVARILGHEWETVEIPDGKWENTLYSGVLGSYDLSAATRDFDYADRVSVEEALRQSVLWQVDHPPETGEALILVDNESYAIEDRILASAA